MTADRWAAAGSRSAVAGEIRAAVGAARRLSAAGQEMGTGCWAVPLAGLGRPALRPAERTASETGADTLCRWQLKVRWVARIWGKLCVAGPRNLP